MKDHVLHVLSIIKQPLIYHCCKEIMKVLAGLADTRQITTSFYLSFYIDTFVTNQNYRQKAL